MPEFIRVATVAEVPPGTIKAVEVQGLQIALYNLGGEFFATQEHCTHADAPLTDGAIEDGEVICPWHGARFNIKNGQATCGPAYGDLSTYRVRVVGDAVEIEV